MELVPLENVNLGVQKLQKSIEDSPRKKAHTVIEQQHLSFQDADIYFIMPRHFT